MAGLLSNLLRWRAAIGQFFVRRAKDRDSQPAPAPKLGPPSEEARRLFDCRRFD